MIDRARRYISHMPTAISGSGGHVATFNVAVVLIRGFALPEAEAYDLISEWNQTHTSRPWSEPELRHKLRSAANSSKPLGYLLSPSDQRARRSFPDFESDAERRARLRSLWPKLHHLTCGELHAIADLRRLSFASVDLCAKAGYLRRTHIDGHRCFTIAEGRFAQARRFDGKPLTTREGEEIKAKNLPGCEGAFLGQRWLAESHSVLLVEGAIGLLEATDAIIIADRNDWCPLAATSSGSRFQRDPALLEKLTGRRVRIVPDADESGLDAAAIWQAELESAGAAVDAVALPVGAKDMGDIVAQQPRHLEFLTNLFQ